jgi:hypothetical protein
MFNATVCFRAQTREHSKTLAATVAEPVSRETQYFLANIGKVKSVGGLITFGTL